MNYSSYTHQLCVRRNLNLLNLFAVCGIENPVSLASRVASLSTHLHWSNTRANATSL
jgi:hypothetical protein